MFAQSKNHLLFAKKLQQNSLRWKAGPNHWKNLEKKNKPINLALNHFDDFYKNVFGKKWHSIRLGLLCPHKYCAIVNNYSDTEKIISRFENEGAFNLRNLFELQANKLTRRKKINSDEQGLDNIYKVERNLGSREKSNYEEKIVDQPNGNVTNNQLLKTPDGTKLQKTQNSSLEDSMATANIDWSRQVDSSVGLSSGAFYEYIPATKLKGKEDWVPESQHYEYYSQSTSFPIEVQKERTLNFPENLQVYLFENGNTRNFDSAKFGTTGVLDYYLMDASSLFPVLALNLSPGDTVLDMCAAPGGKSVACLQTLYPDFVVCNDLSESRTKRMTRVMDQYFFYLEKKVKITRMDGLRISDSNTYSKILVDVPCTTDRVSLSENDNNIFRPDRLKERIHLPELQADLLCSALQLVKVGGTVVYSTCSLSPIQNDGVVHMALKKIWEETSVKVIVKDLSEALIPAEEFFCIGKFGLRYGHIILPFLPKNFGPMYFCKFVRSL